MLEGPSALLPNSRLAPWTDGGFQRDPLPLWTYSALALPTRQHRPIGPALSACRFFFPANLVSESVHLYT